MLYCLGINFLEFLFQIFLMDGWLNQWIQRAGCTDNRLLGAPRAGPLCMPRPCFLQSLFPGQFLLQEDFSKVPPPPPQPSQFCFLPFPIPGAFTRPWSPRHAEGVEGKHCQFPVGEFSLGRLENPAQPFTGPAAAGLGLV